MAQDDDIKKNKNNKQKNKTKNQAKNKAKTKLNTTQHNTENNISATNRHSLNRIDLFTWAR
jgi:hypothetical protein